MPLVPVGPMRTSTSHCAEDNSPRLSRMWPHTSGYQSCGWAGITSDAIRNRASPPLWSMNWLWGIEYLRHKVSWLTRPPLVVGQFDQEVTRR